MTTPNDLGQKTMAASMPVTIASDQPALPITVPGTLPVDVTDEAGRLLGIVSVSNFPAVQPVSDNGGSLTVDTPQLPAALVGGRLDVNNGAWLGSAAPTVGQKVMASSIPVVVASDQNVLGTEATLLAILAALGGSTAPSNTGFATSFRTLGNAATPQNLMSIENGAGNDKIVHVRSVHVTMDATAVLTAVVPYFGISRPAALPTGGTTLTKTQSDTTQSADAQIVVRGATASDGGAATAITATAATRIRQSFGKRTHTAVGEQLGQQRIILLDNDDPPIILQANESLLLQVIAAAAASNAATNHYLCCIEWEEF